MGTQATIFSCEIFNHYLKLIQLSDTEQKAAPSCRIMVLTKMQRLKPELIL